MEKDYVALFHEEIDLLRIVKFLMLLDAKIRLVDHPVPVGVLVVEELRLMGFRNYLQSPVLDRRVL